MNNTFVFTLYRARDNNYSRVTNSLIVKTEGSTPLIPKSTTGKNPETDPYTYHPHNLFPAIHLDDIIPFPSWSYNWPFSKRFSHQNLVRISVFSISAI
jgi:hypothetical protein